MAIGGCEVSYCFFKKLYLVGMKIVGSIGAKYAMGAEKVSRRIAQSAGA